MSEYPSPPVPADCDCTDLDGFMLNVERLMASELVALSTHEVVAAAMFLWCRAWKQRPAASMPDDDRVLAAYARMPLPRFKRLKGEVLRGFVRCADGRLYHGVLAVEALKAWEKKKTFLAKREADAERLRKWRQSQKETQDDTRDTTDDETRFVPEGQGQGQGQGQYRDRDSKKERKEDFDPSASAAGKKRTKKTALPADWHPTLDQLAYAKSQGCADPADTAERFRLYHLKEGTLGADWNLGFQYWCRNEKNFRKGGASPTTNGDYKNDPAWKGVQ